MEKYLEGIKAKFENEILLLSEKLDSDVRETYCQGVDVNECT